MTQATDPSNRYRKKVPKPRSGNRNSSFSLSIFSLFQSDDLSFQGQENPPVYRNVGLTCWYSGCWIAARSIGFMGESKNTGLYRWLPIPGTIFGKPLEDRRYRCCPGTFFVYLSGDSNDVAGTLWKPLEPLTLDSVRSLCIHSTSPSDIIMTRFR